MGNKLTRWFWGFGGFFFIYTGTQTGLEGDTAMATAEYVIAVCCFLGLVYYAIDARIAQLEERLTKETKVQAEPE